ncbi:hypothetical protein [Undibacter mobilis]|uniref:hypothetical protein n=1 Tax=Undibacter mobilis TaxID=2292256 RepID=UPI0011C07FFA|nr:hypothetical protein [Undibacter mobilis]
MVYIPKDIRETKLWMQLPAALAHIEATCGEATGWLELRQALIDGEIPARWGFDAARVFPLIYEPKPLFSEDPVTTNPRYWHAYGSKPPFDGLLFDSDEWRGQADYKPTLPRRRLFLLKQKILEFWPLNTSLISSVAKPPTPRRAKTATVEVIYRLAREVYSNAEGKPPNSDEAARLIAKAAKKPGSTVGKIDRELVRSVLRKPEFSAKRWSRGQRKTSNNSPK